MTSIIKVDTLQTAAGGVPTAADLGINTSGTLNNIYHKRTSVETSTSSTSPVAAVSFSVPMDTGNFNYLIQFHTPIKKGSTVNDGTNLYIQLNGAVKGTAYHRGFALATSSYMNQDIFTLIESGYSGGNNVTVVGAISSYGGTLVDTHDNSPNSTTTGSRLIVWEYAK